MGSSGRIWGSVPSKISEVLRTMNWQFWLQNNRAVETLLVGTNRL